jgi:uncharacterized membrane protein YdjX (TVP38/TMEM64 family)
MSAGVRGERIHPFCGHSSLCVVLCCAAPSARDDAPCYRGPGLPLPPTEKPSKSLVALRLAALAVVLLALLIAWRTGFLAHLGEPARVARELVALGAWGYLAFVVAYTLLQPFGVPGTVFVFAAPLIWPWPIAFALSMTGTMTASVVGFTFARFVARDWLSGRIPPRFRAYDEALARRGFATVFVLRFIFWMPPLLHAFFGVSRVRFWTHFWGSLVGYVVPLLAVSFFGQRVFEVLRAQPPTVWLGVGAAVAVGVLVAFAISRRSSKDRRRD